MVHAGRQEFWGYGSRKTGYHQQICCHQQVLFLLDVLDGGGKSVDKKYLAYWQNHEVWSTITFPLEKPPCRHEAVWQTVVYSFAPRGRVQSCISHFYPEVTRFGSGSFMRSQIACFIFMGWWWTSIPHQCWSIDMVIRNWSNLLGSIVLEVRLGFE